MTRTRLGPALAAVLSAALPFAAACAPIQAGAAAVVGQDRITESQLHRAVVRGLADPQARQSVGADRPGYQRQVLARMINHDIVTAAARAKGVSVTEGEVDSRIAAFAQQAGGEAQLDQQAAQSGIAVSDIRPFVRDLVLNQAVGDALTRDLRVDPAQLEALYQQNIAQYDQVHAAHILVATPALAASILAKVKADPGSFAALAARYSLDSSNKAKGGDLGFAGRGTYVAPFEQAIFAARPGSFLVVHTQFGYHVVHVIERHTTTLAQAAPALRGQALQAESQSAVRSYLAATARRLGVRVNPRFGRWDPVQGTVVAPGYDPKKDVSSPSPQATPAGTSDTSNTGGNATDQPPPAG